MRVYEKKQYIFILSPKENESGRKLIVGELNRKYDIWEKYYINEPPTIDKDGCSVYLVHVWEG